PFGVSDSIRPFLGPISSDAFQVSAFAFPFPAVPTLSEAFRRSDRPSISDFIGDATSKPNPVKNEEVTSSGE
ncbi:hypothetical protein, partial [Streptomyces sp. NPDC088789]|uniref:hypothetical protein n=1 Tax=Streptomyces sp. NPDC088789 TaxID=3365899 RepID=UPI00381FBBAD